MILTMLTALAMLQGPRTTPPPPPVNPEVRITEVRKADGTLAARAMIFTDGGALQVRVQAAGLPPGRYGVHFHAVGRCEAPAFESAGPHWNPTGRRHGSLNPQGRHLGDLDNLEVDADRAGRLEFAIPGATSTGPHGMFDADGISIVIHAAPDDYRTDPSGNSGARLACGVFNP